jgi:hypothetical protein
MELTLVRKILRVREGSADLTALLLICSQFMFVKTQNGHPRLYHELGKNESTNASAHIALAASRMWRHTRL